ncbi:MAG: DNA polymerase III subunit gamma/tau [Candidatus Contendobacter odensis]|uniref:DNA polymerase III subunit gamma/tau n=1 Tax=Candidatus Contendibacter odensensis TaxID=1400860 RepID=A0A2G6PGX1_9GAMM|nr:MAG: DNA polymerase III subunit gamma/tau [Candidatus Contendobacter odensis]
MSYQVLARKWRPRTFHELAGQAHVVRALTHALDRQRLHHAFLFTGTRGVGKTTIARIFAKSLNCEQGVSSHPCGECAACRAIDGGHFLDLIEVDAASRTKVEDTRELLDNVQYAPTQGCYKVYLIDEVHMLSTHSFNALLKTLEEPPPHIKFLLATTDPQKLPATVLSRCLQFNLKRLPINTIVDYLARVLKAEAISYELAAVRLIARASDGSMRDALSLLDQAIAFCDDELTQATVATMLGSVDPQRVKALLEALVAGNAAALLQQVVVLDEHAPDYAAVLAELLSLLQHVAVAQLAPDAMTEDSEVDAEDVRRFAGLLSPEDIQLFYQIVLLGRRDLPLMPDPRAGFEMVLLRMLCFHPATPDPVISTAATASEPLDVSAVPDRSSVSAPTTLITPVPLAEAATQQPAGPVASTSTSTSAAATVDPMALEWDALATQLPLTGIARQVAMNCALLEHKENAFRLMLESRHAQMLSKSVKERIKLALEQHLGVSVDLNIQVGSMATATTPVQQQEQHQVKRQEAAVEQARRDPHVQTMQKLFDAQITEVRALDDDKGDG